MPSYINSGHKALGCLPTFLISLQKCLVCGDDEVVIRCHQCRYSTYLCALCDAEVHNEHPLHDREYWNGEYFSFILPTRYPCPRTGNLIDIGMSCT